jgi:EAL domain-containing protein (putative c-di-GMP-specific phosphodiesterase class I)
MARGLRVAVIAEGVETAEHARVLRKLGCELAQGFHYARPVPAHDFELLLGLPLPAATVSAA